MYALKRSTICQIIWKLPPHPPSGPSGCNSLCSNQKECVCVLLKWQGQSLLWPGHFILECRTRAFGPWMQHTAHTLSLTDCASKNTPARAKNAFSVPSVPSLYLFLLPVRLNFFFLFSLHAFSVQCRTEGMSTFRLVAAVWAFQTSGLLHLFCAVNSPCRLTHLKNSPTQWHHWLPVSFFCCLTFTSSFVLVGTVGSLGNVANYYRTNIVVWKWLPFFYSYQRTVFIFKRVTR